MQAPLFQPASYSHKRPDDEHPLNAIDSEWLRLAFVWANAARIRGNRPFGAVIVASDGRILAEAFSNSHETGDHTGHAQMNAIRQVGKAQTPAAVVAGATLYCSAEPCTMCASAMCCAGLRRIVYGVDRPRLHQLQPHLRTSSLSCHEVFASALMPIECHGPSLVHEALAVYQDHWFSA